MAVSSLENSVANKVETDNYQAFDAKSSRFERLRRRVAVYGLVGSLAVTSTFAGIAKASSGKESSNPYSDLSGPQIQLVCAYPKDAPNCDMFHVEQIGEQMQAYLGDPTHGASGFSARLAMKDGKISVIPVQLDASSVEVVQMAADSRGNPNASDNLLDYTRNQIHTKTSSDPQTEYATFVTNTAGLEQIVSCDPGGNWNGMNTPGNRNVMVSYLDSFCTDPSYSYLSYASLKAPAIFNLAELFHNDGYLNPCNQGFMTGGWSSQDKNLLDGSSKFLQDWWQTNIGNWMKSTPGTPGCAGADVDPRMDWQINTSTNGRGQFAYWLKDASGNLMPIKPDPGNRLEAGQLNVNLGRYVPIEYEARYLPVKGEKLLGYIGSCTGQICDFESDQPISIEARVKTTSQFSLGIKARGVKISGKGISCPTDCAEMLPAGTVEKLTAKTSHKGARIVWKNCGKVLGNVCTVVMNKNKIVSAGVR